jgi:hypothetical protein
MQYADDTAVVATSLNPLLLVGYLKAYSDRMYLWLREWTFATKVPKSTAMLFVKAAKGI